MSKAIDMLEPDKGVTCVVCVVVPKLYYRAKSARLRRRCSMLAHLNPSMVSLALTRQSSQFLSR